MSAVTALKNFGTGLVTYRGREGQLLFLGHRLSGLGTLLFLTTHIVDTSFAYFWPEGYGHAIELYRSAPFMIGEILLVAAVIFHGVNGLKIILNDYFPTLWNKHDERQSFWRVAGLTVLLWLPAAFVMGRSLLTSLAGGAHEIASESDVVARTNAALIATPVIFVVVLVGLVAGLKFKQRGQAPARTVSVPKTFETYSWQFMRISGVLLIPLVWCHTLIQDILVGVHSIDLSYVQMRWGMLGWQIYDIALLAFTFAHGMNGLRAIAEDHIHNPTLLRAAKGVIIAAWAIISLIGAVAIVMIRPA